MQRNFIFALAFVSSGFPLHSGAHAQTPDQRSENECKQLYLINTQPANWDRYYECIGSSNANVPESNRSDPAFENPPATARQPPEPPAGLERGIERNDG